MWLLNVLVLFNVVAQTSLVLMLALGSQGAGAAPVAGGAVVALFVLAVFYARWLFPTLGTGQIMLVLALKESGVLVLLGLAGGLVLLLRWLF
ncbi:MAG: hypothetical protein JXR96_04945 [Deltaproteobacteria bacterium]|nr:hypothetical protein [Deltaproteobacteria bacterium]